METSREPGTKLGLIKWAVNGIVVEWRSVTQCISWYLPQELRELSRRKGVCSAEPEVCSIRGLWSQIIPFEIPALCDFEQLPSLLWTFVSLPGKCSNNTCLPSGHALREKEDSLSLSGSSILSLAHRRHSVNGSGYYWSEANRQKQHQLEIYKHDRYAARLSLTSIMAGISHSEHRVLSQAKRSFGAFPFSTVMPLRNNPWPCRAAKFHSGAESCWRRPGQLVPLSLKGRGLQGPQTWVWIFIPLATQARITHTGQKGKHMTQASVCSQIGHCVQPHCPQAPTFHAKPQSLKVQMNETFSVDWFKEKLWAFGPKKFF